MAVSAVHLMLVSLNLTDEPVGYTPPLGPAVDFTVRYNQRDAFQLWRQRQHARDRHAACCRLYRFPPGG